MRKLFIVTAILVAILVFVWWAKSTNFSPFSFASTFPRTTGTLGVTSNTAIPTPLPVEIIITVTPNGFVPDALMISPNTKITWINKSGNTAGISSDPQNAYTDLNLGDFGENSSVSLTFTRSGRYHYLNGQNSTQKGTLVVR